MHKIRQKDKRECGVNVTNIEVSSKWKEVVWERERERERAENVCALVWMFNVYWSARKLTCTFNLLLLTTQIKGGI